MSRMLTVKLYRRRVVKLRGDMKGNSGHHALVAGAGNTVGITRLSRGGQYRGHHALVAGAGNTVGITRLSRGGQYRAKDRRAGRVQHSSDRRCPVPRLTRGPRGQRGQRRGRSHPVSTAPGGGGRSPAWDGTRSGAVRQPRPMTSRHAHVTLHRGARDDTPRDT